MERTGQKEKGRREWVKEEEEKWVKEGRDGEMERVDSTLDITEKKGQRS